MLLRIYSRGFISENNPGTNPYYYLYSGLLFRMITPNDFNSDNHTAMNIVNSSGHLGGSWTNNATGGVHLHELC